MKFAILIFTVLVFSTLCASEKMLAGIYPDMREFRLKKPQGFKNITMDDLKINLERIQSISELRPLPADRDALLKIAKFYRDNPDGQDAWSKQNSVHVLKLINEWMLPKSHHPAYQVRWVRLEPVVEAYFFTGNPQVGRFIHDYVMHAMTLDKWFWMGQTYRPYMEHKGKMRFADLLSLEFARVLNPLLTRCRELFSAEELKLIESKYREYVLESCNDDLLRRQKWTANNWNAVLSGALLLSAKYFGDVPKAEFAKGLLKSYFQEKIEDDGSYGEGAGYADYALSVIPSIYPYLSMKEREDFFKDSPLRNFAKWYLYHDFCNTEKFYRVSFGDDNYFYRPSVGSMYVLALTYGDPAAAYLGSRMPYRKPWWNASVNSLLIGGGKDPAVSSPEVLNLPLVAKFANGEAFIRSGWKTEDAVFASYLIYPGKVNTHKRPECGNFVFGYNGVPLVMHSGNTNLYRQPIHQLSIQTSAANTITIDGMNQLASGKQNARYIEFNENKDMVIIRCDLRSAYPQPMKTMIRTFAWLKTKKQLVIIDQLKAKQDEFEFKARLHLNNIFRDTELERNGDNLFFYRHPKAVLHIHASGKADVSKGYTVSERFSNWDEASQQKEADSGNVHVISYGPAKKTGKAILFAVLGEKRIEVKSNPNGLLVDGILIPYFH